MHTTVDTCDSDLTPRCDVFRESFCVMDMVAILVQKQRMDCKYGLPFYKLGP